MKIFPIKLMSNYDKLKNLINIMDAAQKSKQIKISKNFPDIKPDKFIKNEK